MLGIGSLETRLDRLESQMGRLVDGVERLVELIEERGVDNVLEKSSKTGLDSLQDYVVD